MITIGGVVHDEGEISPFRRTLESAGNRLADLAKRASPMVALEIRREIVAVREASAAVEGLPCNMCDGSGVVIRGSKANVETVKCPCCGGTGDL